MLLDSIVLPSNYSISNKGKAYCKAQNKIQWTKPKIIDHIKLLVC